MCLRKEIDGFALNRIQAAVIAESWRLVQVSAAVVSAVAKYLAKPVEGLSYTRYLQKSASDVYIARPVIRNLEIKD